MDGEPAGPAAAVSEPGREGPPGGRGELYLMVALLAAASGAVLLLANRSWLTVRAARPAPFGPLSLGVSGRHLYPALTGLAVVGLLAAVLVLFTGTLVRRLLALLVLAGSVWVAVTSVRFLSDPTGYGNRDLIGDRAGLGTHTETVLRHPVWSVLTLAAAALALLTAALLAARAPRWSGGLSRRYSAPAEAARSQDPWRQLDRGEDPTIGDG
ncbi:MAG TPA: Trp biosynthesis-associated membrane protein [Jatrophihabitans sp.]|nr:Trp biosynthesis-associated membrane protein [Jatrophihabitans sp.]